MAATSTAAAAAVHFRRLRPSHSLQRAVICFLCVVTESYRALEIFFSGIPDSSLKDCSLSLVELFLEWNHQNLAVPALLDVNQKLRKRDTGREILITLEDFIRRRPSPPQSIKPDDDSSYIWTVSLLERLCSCYRRSVTHWKIGLHILITWHLNWPRILKALCMSMYPSRNVLHKSITIKADVTSNYYYLAKMVLERQNCVEI